MKIVYFAWLRDRIGMGEEIVDPPDDINDVSRLIGWLRGRSPAHESALADISMVRVAINLEYANLSQTIKPEDEVAFFPPVTGG